MGVRMGPAFLAGATLAEERAEVEGVVGLGAADY